MLNAAYDKLSDMQLNLIKSFRYLHNEQELKEIDSLINFYLEKKLDEAIVKVESEKGYSADIYEAWLNSPDKVVRK